MRLGAICVLSLISHHFVCNSYAIRVQKFMTLRVHFRYNTSIHQRLADD